VVRSISMESSSSLSISSEEVGVQLCGRCRSERGAVGGSVAGVDRLAWVVAADAAEGGVRSSFIALFGGEVLRTSRGGLEGFSRVVLVVGDEVGGGLEAAAE
jgi:hypothetical protein